jgi:hypothetical protein
VARNSGLQDRTSSTTPAATAEAPLDSAWDGLSGSSGCAMSSPGHSSRTAGPRLAKGRSLPLRSGQRNQRPPGLPGAMHSTRGSLAGSPSPSVQLAWVDQGGLDASRPVGMTSTAPRPPRPALDAYSSASSSIGLVLPSTYEGQSTTSAPSSTARAIAAGNEYTSTSGLGMQYSRADASGATPRNLRVPTAHPTINVPWG